MAPDDEWTREAIRLHRRYLTEVVEAYGLCPWADRAVREGRVRERVVLQSDDTSMEASLAAIDAWRVDSNVDVAFVIYPRLRVTRHGFHDFTARVRDADTPRHELGRVPFVFAAFHPDANPDTTDAERLIPFLRRTPDPTLQFLRHSVLDSIRNGVSEGTQFFNIENLDAALACAVQPPLRERIAKANLASITRVGLDVVQACLEDIRRDREDTYRALASRGERVAFKGDSVRPPG